MFLNDPRLKILCLQALKYPSANAVTQNVQKSDTTASNMLCQLERVVWKRTQKQPSIMARPLFLNSLLIRSLADIAVHICQIRRSDGNFFLKRANKYFFVSGPSN